MTATTSKEFPIRVGRCYLIGKHKPLYVFRYHVTYDPEEKIRVFGYNLPGSLADYMKTIHVESKPPHRTIAEIENTPAPKIISFVFTSKSKITEVQP